MIKAPAAFFDEEIRDGFKVTAAMKQVWFVELDLMQKLLDVCRNNDIKIFASGGTMLGAVRHHGFIPWDDDIDMMMFREDYDKLCDIAADEFKEPYFFQTAYSDESCLRGHAQLRNSSTTGMLEYESYRVKFNQGIFIDIFPLDSVISDEGKFKRQARKAKLLKKYFMSLNYYLNYNDFLKEYTGSERIKKILSKVCNRFYSYNKAYEKYESVCKQYNYLQTEMISTLSFVFDCKQHFKYREDYRDLIDVDFEFLKIPIGKNYVHALDKRYGNWRKFEKGSAVHGNVIFDTTIPYDEYIKKNFIR